jgi:hypothetical protein
MVRRRGVDSKVPDIGVAGNPGVGVGVGVGDGAGVPGAGVGAGVGVGVGTGIACGTLQPAPQPRMETFPTVSPSRILVQLQLLASLRSTKKPNGSTVTLSRYSPEGKPVMSIA